MRIGIVAGEMSGDYLAAGLMRELRRHFPAARFEGIGGPRMEAEGCTSFHPLESLSVMGLVEVLRHLPGLLAIRRDLVRRFQADPPDLFIGIDAPDFNLGLERRLREQGIPTVHYVSPTVWAWRQGRIRDIARSVDRMLCIFPFEREFFRHHDVPATFVGHPLADEVPETPDQAGARSALDLPAEGAMVALLPGSRMSEVKHLGPLFLETAAWLFQHRPDLRFIVPCATGPIAEHMRGLAAAHTDGMPVTLVDGRSRECLAAATVALLASGTASLEAMLHKRPMVVAYKVSALTGWLARRLVKVDHFAMPNLIANRRMVEEFAQQDAVTGNLGPAVLDLLEHPEKRERLIAEFTALHRTLRQDASVQAAEAVAQLLEERGHARLTEEGGSV
ncbi:lipid-A-disaccharide synthase [Aquisalimonas sp.]|uniref:lipid-A-disaccharide synthase n=1 Tax=Aquisalimonas sp. TaxID=1872621 RepID=UPI0025BF9258|nr:lipid-A-disaccharide synthase [Aquisalimonas sp.]